MTFGKWKSRARMKTRLDVLFAKAKEFIMKKNA